MLLIIDGTFSVLICKKLKSSFVKQFTAFSTEDICSHLLACTKIISKESRLDNVQIHTLKYMIKCKYMINI